MSKLNQLKERILNSKAQQVMAITSVGMGLKLVLDLMIAARFGTTEAADELIIALLLPLYVDTVTREGTKFSLVPIFIQLKEEKGPENFNRFVSGLVNILILLSSVLVILIYVSSTSIIKIIGPGLSKAAVLNSSLLLDLLLPLIVALPVISILGVLLDSQKKFNFVALRNFIIPLVAIVCLTAGWVSKNAALFVVIGYTFGFVSYGVILWIVAKRNSYNHSWKALPERGDIGRIRAAISWPTFGFVIRQGGRVAEKSIASLVGVGGVASYYYGFRIYSAIQTIVGTSLATTSLPNLSNVSEEAKFKTIIKKNLRMILMITIPIAIILGFFSDHIIQIIFSRGYFDAYSTERTANVLTWLSTGLVFMCMIPVLNAALYAKQRYRTVFIYMVFLTFLNVTTGVFLASIWGLNGLAISVSLTAIVSVAILLFVNFRVKNK